MLPIIADALPIEVSLECKFVKFVKSTMGSHNKSVAYMANLMKSNCNSTFGHNIRHLYLKEASVANLKSPISYLNSVN